MINNIQIENYKSIRELNLDMKPINVLIGSNGAGKSNFISFFKFLKAIYDRNLQIHVAEEGSSEDILHFGSKVSEYVWGWIEFDSVTPTTNAYSFRLKPDSDSDFYFDREAIAFHDKVRYSEPYIDTIGVGGHNESFLPKSTNSIAGHVRKYMKSFRVFHFHDTSKTSKLRKPAQLNDNDFLREDGSNLPAFLYWMQEKHPKDFKKIEMVVRSVAPYFDSFNLAPDKLNEDQIRLRWKEKGSDAYFEAKHLSDGTLRFIALTTLLLQPEAPEVIIIDEPELGLHPFAINKLAGLIKKASARTQIIVSTQSVNLVDNFTPEDIITVDREDNQSVFKRQDSDELKDWLDDYSISDLWNKNVIGGRP
ncbi:AAA family ATPase [Dysgonomonas sp. HDW5A]|uniref:AAA family ATPase n=1 Tax=Dysgonomonas sp. HDW5A TaxID=2714926 RepID=UPI00140A4D1E|nr:AAA family ATPase [Dysgonomonas sp. HDW5A]QIK59684.1 AAA family ATPase [Dysgonomonas sp. HDW5A]